MQIHAQRVHRHHFGRLRADQFGDAIAQAFVKGHPGGFATEMPFHCQPRPAIHLRFHRIACRTRLQAERIAAEVVQGVITMRRNQELVAKAAQRIGSIARQGVQFSGRSVERW